MVSSIAQNRFMTYLYSSFHVPFHTGALPSPAPPIAMIDRGFVALLWCSELLSKGLLASQRLKGIENRSMPDCSAKPAIIVEDSRTRNDCRVIDHNNRLGIFPVDL